MSNETVRASAVILAGGQSRRLGQDKRRLRLWGEDGPTLLERTIATVAGLCDDVVVVLNDPEAWPGLAGRHVPDAYADGGALGGIYSGLLAAAEEHALVVACDMPLLSQALLRALLERPRHYDVLAPRSPSPGATRNSLDLETLHAVYGKGCLGPMRAALEGGRRQIASFFPEVRVAIFEPEETRAHDPRGYSFLNINTVEQMAEAMAALRET
jgi:molybdopterin-guanine dinucleotide biosynthesis protein A